MASSRIKIGGVFQDHPGDRHPLALATGETVATLSHHGLVTIRQSHDAIVDERGPRRHLHLLVGRVGTAVAEVVRDGPAEQVALLGHHADRRCDRRRGQVTNIMAVDRHRAALNVVEPGHQIRDRRLPRTGGTDQRGQLSRGDAQRHAVQRGIERWFRLSLSAAIAKGHVRERDLTEDLVGLQRERVGSVGDRRAQVDQLEDPPKQRQR